MADMRINGSTGGFASQRACAVIAAGGIGSRLGHKGGKQLMKVAGLPLVSWSLIAFDQAATIGHIVLVCPPERRDDMRAQAVEPLGLSTPVTFADAGATRQASTRAGVEAAPAEFGIVAIHDGARPLIRSEVIDQAVQALEAGGAHGPGSSSPHPPLDGVVCGQPAVDTMKQVGAGGLIAGTPDRALLWSVQTPQVFPVGVMRRAYAAAEVAGFVGTDDASLVEHIGGNVLLLDTPRDNLQVTVPEDVPLIEALLRLRG